MTSHSAMKQSNQLQSIHLLATFLLAFFFINKNNKKALNKLRTIQNLSWLFYLMWVNVQLVLLSLTLVKTTEIRFDLPHCWYSSSKTMGSYAFDNSVDNMLKYNKIYFDVLWQQVIFEKTSKVICVSFMQYTQTKP